MTWFLVFSSVAAAGVTWVATGLVLRLLRRRAILDVPNQRSSHSEPTPRGGGIAVVASIAAVAIVWAVVGVLPATWWPLLAALAGLVLISGADDIRSMPVWLRLTVHLACVVTGVSLLAEYQLVFQGLLPLWLDRLLTILAWLWFINLYNFMDGIDGITCGETIAICGGLFAVSFVATSDTPIPALALVVAAASAGFLPWNWSPARIFLGDVGSVGLGYICGWLLLVTAADGQWGVALILPLYYLADATLTLVRRAVRLEPLWRAHASHFYQRASQRIGSHTRVTLTIATANLLLIGAAIAGASTVSIWIELIFSAGVVAVLLWYLARGISP